MQNSPPARKSDIIEQLIPHALKPALDSYIIKLLPRIDIKSRSKLKMDLQWQWQRCKEPIDHRQYEKHCEQVSFACMEHFIASSAIHEFSRMQDLFNDNYTMGFKKSVDQVLLKTDEEKSHYPNYKIFGWRHKTVEFTYRLRREEERFVFDSAIVLRTDVEGEKCDAAGCDISFSGCRVKTQRQYTNYFGEQRLVDIEFVGLPGMLENQNVWIRYRLLRIEEEGDEVFLSFRREDDDTNPIFIKSLKHLIKKHKSHKRIEVNNTVRAIINRSTSLSGANQFSGLIVCSDRDNLNHVLISQRHSLGLQAELLAHPLALPNMITQTKAGQSKAFLLWASSQTEVRCANLSLKGNVDEINQLFREWSQANWQKIFIVKSETIDKSHVKQGGSIPPNVAKTVDKMNAPLSENLKGFADKLEKLSFVEDVSYVFDTLNINNNRSVGSTLNLDQFLLRKNCGVVKQIPIDAQVINDYLDTYRFTQDCNFLYGSEQTSIVNGFANYREATLCLNHQIMTGFPQGEVEVQWNVDGINLSLKAKVLEHDVLHKRTKVRWLHPIAEVTVLFEELVELKGLAPGFSQDIKASRLGYVIRNMVMTNLPTLTIFALQEKNELFFRFISGHHALLPEFIDKQKKVKLDSLLTRNHY